MTMPHLMNCAHMDGGWCLDCVGEQYAEIERLRADRDCEKRMRKNSDDLATDLRLALEAVIADPADTGLAWAVLQRIHGPNVRANRRIAAPQLPE